MLRIFTLRSPDKTIAQLIQTIEPLEPPQMGVQPMHDGAPSRMVHRLCGLSV